MRIRIRYIGPIRLKLGKKEEELEIPSETTLKEFLDKLTDMYGILFKEEIFEPDGKTIKDGLVVTVNGIAMNQLNGVKSLLKEGDIISLLPFFAGGG